MQTDLPKLESGAELTDGDRQFRYWSHVQLLLHAETYFHHHELGLARNQNEGK